MFCYFSLLGRFDGILDRMVVNTSLNPFWHKPIPEQSKRTGWWLVKVMNSFWCKEGSRLERQIRGLQKSKESNSSAVHVPKRIQHITPPNTNRRIFIPIVMFLKLKSYHLRFIWISYLEIWERLFGFGAQNVQPSSAFLCDGMNMVIPEGWSSDSLVSVIV